MPAFAFYASLSEWAADAHPALPVYAIFTDAPAGETVGGALRLRRNIITVAQLRPPLVAMYYLKLGLVEQWSGQTNGTPTQVTERDQTCWDLIQAWLVEQGFDLRHALIAPPAGMLPLSGDLPEFIGYDKEADRFYRR